MLLRYGRGWGRVLTGGLLKDCHRGHGEHGKNHKGKTDVRECAELCLLVEHCPPRGQTRMPDSRRGLRIFQTPPCYPCPPWISLSDPVAIQTHAPSTTRVARRKFVLFADHSIHKQISRIHQNPPLSVSSVANPLRTHRNTNAPGQHDTPPVGIRSRRGISGPDRLQPPVGTATRARLC